MKGVSNYGDNNITSERGKKEKKRMGNFFETYFPKVK